METASFAPKPKTLSPYTHFPPSSSSYLRNFSHFPFPSLVSRDFFGCGICCLRPPGLHFQRKSKKFGFHQFQNTKISCQASLENQVLVIFTFATVAAIPVYLNYLKQKRDYSASELSGLRNPDDHENYSFSTEVSSVTNVEQIMKNSFVQGKIDTQIMDPGIRLSEKEVNFVSEENARDISCRGNLASINEEAHLLKFEANIGMEKCEKNSIAKISQEPGFKVVDLSPPFATLSEAALNPENSSMPESLPRGIPELPFGDSMLHGVVAEPSLNGSTYAEIHQDSALKCEKPSLNGSTYAEIHQDSELKCEIAKEGELQVLNSNGFFGEITKAPDAFYGERCPSAVSPYSPTQNSNGFSELQRPHSIQNGADTLSNTDYQEGNVLVASPKEDSPNTRKQFVKRMGYMDRKHTLQRGDRVVPKFPRQNGMNVKNKNDPSECLRIYNCWLREGRLIDCIELLESLEMKGLLDMDKVYHARFFKTCESQKAVNEAFRFVKLISNPTLSTFNMLLSVCACSQDSDGAFQVLPLVKEAGLKADCKLYTTLISTCAKSGKVDAMFKVFHEMVNAGVEPNVHTYGALIDGCARAGQVAKAFGAYGIMSSKKVKPDRVVFNALITACGQSGAVDRAFDVLAEMRAEPQSIDPDHVTIGALMKTCSQAGQVDRALEVYKMIHLYKIKGTPDVYTIAVNSCSQKGDLEFALSVYNDMKRNGVAPDEVFFSALIDVAGHAGKLDIAFEILKDAKIQGMQLGNVSYSSLMGACSNAKNWQRALELYEDIKAVKLLPTVSTLNAMLTAMCDGEQLQKAKEVLGEMRKIGVCPNTITYSILLVACEKKDELELGFELLSQAKRDGVVPNQIMCKCFTSLCLRRFEKAVSLGESILSFNSGNVQIDNQWTLWSLMAYRETIAAGVVPTIEIFSQVLGCLRLPCDSSLRNRLVENLGVSADSSRRSKMYSLLDGFGEYDPRSFSLLEEAASLGVVPCVSFKQSPIVVDARKFEIHTIEVYILTILRGLKHRLAAGAKLPNVTILVPVEKTQITSYKGYKTINLAGRVAQAVGALLRRLGLPFQGNESFGKIRISGLAIKRWFQPKLALPCDRKPIEFNLSPTRLAKGITDQQREIRINNLSRN